MSLRHHVARVSVAGTAVLIGILYLAVRALPLDPDADHAGGHLALALPLLVLLVVVLLLWPPARAGALPRLARGTLVAGLAVSCVGLLMEALGAFGLDGAGENPVNGLATLHDIGNSVWVLGMTAVGASALMSSVDLLAEAHGVENSRALAAAGAVVLLAVTAFAVGGFLRSY